MKKENWECSMAFEAIKELERDEQQVISLENMIQAYYDGKLNRAQKRLTRLEIKRHIRTFGHK